LAGFRRAAHVLEQRVRSGPALRRNRSTHEGQGERRRRIRFRRALALRRAAEHLGEPRHGVLDSAVRRHYPDLARPGVGGHAGRGHPGLRAPSYLGWQSGSETRPILRTPEELACRTDPPATNRKVAKLPAPWPYAPPPS